VAPTRGAQAVVVSDEVRVLLAGAGRAGLVHGRNLAGRVPGARIAVVADPSRQARESAAAQLGCEKTSADPVAAATSEDVDAVVIASPTFTHADIAIAALQAGKHVLCEKPLASTLEEADAVGAAARASSGRFAMAFMRRFDPGFVRAADRIAAGDIGKPLLIRATGRGPGLPPEWAWDPRSSGGLIAEVNSHDLDTVRWLSGQEYSAVYAAGRAAKRPDIAEQHPGFVDVFAATFELDGSGLAQVDGACPADYGYDARVEVYGTEGMLLLGGPAATAPVVVTAAGDVTTDAVASWQARFAEAYRAEDAHLVGLARGADEPRATLDDGIAALEAVVAANRSMHKGRKIAFEEVTRR
jgi:predicted dehydrogenase